MISALFGDRGFIDMRLMELESYSLIACACLLMYDWVITFPAEVKHIWMKRWTLPTMLFVANRAVTLFCVLAYVTPLPHRLFVTLKSSNLLIDTTSCTQCRSCKPQILVLWTSMLLVRVLWVVFSGLRIHAVGGKLWSLTILNISLNLVPVITGITTAIHLSGVGPSSGLSAPGSFCGLVLPWSFKLAIYEDGVPRGCIIAADLLVVTVTYMKAREIKKENKYTSLRSPLTSILVQNGTAFFCGLVLVHAAEFALLFTQRDGLPLVYLVQVLGCIVISRFILDLRQAARTDVADQNTRPSFTASSRSRISSIRFASGLGFDGELDNEVEASRYPMEVQNTARTHEGVLELYVVEEEM